MNICDVWRKLGGFKFLVKLLKSPRVAAEIIGWAVMAGVLYSYYRARHHVKTLAFFAALTIAIAIGVLYLVPVAIYEYKGREYHEFRSGGVCVYMPSGKLEHCNNSNTSKVLPNYHLGVRK